jgi:hypothetical protein
MTDTLYVATSYIADRATRELGEDHIVIKAVAESYVLLKQSVEAARFLVRSEAAKTMLAELEIGLFDLDHDACVSSVARRAAEAFEEAKVVPMKRQAAPTLTVVK